MTKNTRNVTSEDIKVGAVLLEVYSDRLLIVNGVCNVIYKELNFGRFLLWEEDDNSGESYRNRVEAKSVVGSYINLISGQQEAVVMPLIYILKNFNIAEK